MSNKPQTTPPKDPPKDPPSDPPSESRKVTVLSERALPGGGKVQVVTDGKRTWKKAPADSGMEPLQ